MTDRYSITERLSWSGEVYRGTMVSVDGFRRPVALKRFGPMTERFAAAFIPEARRAVELHHANVVQALDLVRAPDSAHFLVTEYVEACDLRAWVARDRRLEVAHAAHIAIDCCKALDHAHAIGLVHRDVCPASILVAKTGEVKLADFGLAKVNFQTERRERNGMFAYLAPEAARGEEPDHRLDVFALGIVLWEILTGRRLFLGQTDYQTVELVRDAHVPATDLDPALDAIVRKALAKAVGERWQTAGELGRALAEYTAARGLAISVDEVAERVPPPLPSSTAIDLTVLEEVLALTSVLS